MECMCAQTRPRFILSSKRVLRNGVGTCVNSNGKIPSTGGSEEVRTRDTASHRTASPIHYRLSYSGPHILKPYIQAQIETPTCTGIGCWQGQQTRHPLPHVYQTNNTQDSIPATDSSSCQLVWPVGLLACWPLSHSLCCCLTPLLAADPRSQWSWSTQCGSGWLGPQSAERQSSGSVRGD